MASLNRVDLLGHLGADPEIKSFAGGGRLAMLSLATSEKWKDRATGEVRERTDWHRVVISADGLVGVVERFCRKGSKVMITGKLQTRKWQDADGRDRYTTEVLVAGFAGKLILCGGGGGGGGAGQGQDSYGDYGGQDGGRQTGGGDGVPLDDEIPF